MPNRFTPIQPGTDPSQQMAIINKNFAELDNETVKKLYDDSTGTHRIFIDASVPVIKISKAGVDVTTATDDQLTFNSQQNIFKIVKKITGTIPQFNTTYSGSVTSGGTLLTIPHGLSYTPIANVFIKADMVNINTAAVIASSYVPLPIFPAHPQSLNTYVFPATDGSDYAGFSVIFGVDATNIYIQVQRVITGNSPATILPIPVSVFLLQESAA